MLFSMTLWLYRCAHGSVRFGSFRFETVRFGSDFGVSIPIHIDVARTWVCLCVWFIFYKLSFELVVRLPQLYYGWRTPRHATDTRGERFAAASIHTAMEYQQTQECWKATKSRCRRRRQRQQQQQRHQEQDGKMLEKKTNCTLIENVVMYSMR